MSTLIGCLSALSAAQAWAFVAMYGLRSPWQSNTVGRVIFALVAIIAALLTFAAVQRLVISGPLHPAFWITGYSALNVALGALLWVLWQTQKRK